MKSVRPPHCEHKSAGFSLLEALAALLIISLALIPIYQMQSALADGARRAEQRATWILVSADIMSFLSTLNPMLDGQGEQAFDGVKLSWSAREVARVSRASLVEIEQKTVVLFEIEVTVADKHGQLIYTDDLYSIGWSDLRGETSPAFEPGRR
jgi:Tfp pilus assembly protein PilV